jgi:hypothetical protein
MSGTLSPDAPDVTPAASAPSMFPGYHQDRGDERLDQPTLTPAPRWPLPKRLLFRFSFIYFLLYFLPFPIDALMRLRMVPGLSWLADAAGLISGTWENGQQKYGLWDQGSHAMCLWVGKNMLSLPDTGPGSIIIQSTGSGDTMLKYVEALCFGVIAAAGALLWSIFDRKRQAYPRLFAAWHVYLRFALAAVLLGYGFAKFPPQQFQPPSPEKLVSTYGNSSMMGLLWTFMGASAAYTMFAGLAEIIGGAFLLFRRTALLGALVSIGVMLNVFMLNMCYDVPVKLYSLHLLVTSIIIALPFASRLVCVALLNRPTTPCVLWRPRCSMWQKWSLRGVRICAIVLILGMGLFSSYYSWQRYLNPPPTSPLVGLYKVQSLELGGKPARELSDAQRWRRVSVTRWGTLVVDNYTDQREYIRFKHDETAKTLTLTPQSPSGEGYVLNCTSAEDGSITLDGEYQTGAIKLALTKIDTDKLPLRARGFSWIQEKPVNW